MPKISELTAASSVSSTAQIPINDSGTKQATARLIAERVRKEQFDNVALTDAATISVDASLLTGDNMFTVTLADNRILGNPSNAYDGQELKFQFTQDGTGNKTLTLGNKYVLPTGNTFTLSTEANTIDYMKVIYDSSRDKFDVISFVKGFA